MNRTLNPNEHMSAMVLNAYIQEAIDPPVLHYEVPHWRKQQNSRRKPSFPPLDQIGSEFPYINRSRMAPPMDRVNNRSRSPMKSERRPQDYRSRSPFQQSTTFDRATRPQISNPRPLYPGREESPPRFALRSDVPPRPQQYHQEPIRRSPPPSTRLPYPTDEYSPPRPQLRVQPVSRAGPNPQEITNAIPSTQLEYTSGIPQSETSSMNNKTRPAIPVPRAKSEGSPSGIPVDLIPRPLNLRKAPAARKEVVSMCEYLSLDELESLWQTQDLYSGLINAPAKPCTPLYGRAPVGPMSPPCLADHPALRNEHRQYNNVACA
ncbi:MAG: hypothetical protein GOMPHAMPRED_005321 [Gomphillus americanus]|uniref:Uncharacterized protein n=1 Tax=Gomphillus americanus TaxID=1940652 RepID=A0A8H3IUZ7_9LECA|nr:MAG: hypothetical protein GOMPHAMPRED_005321 [Gomphillus americanus]